jgi:hypothetical protein
MQTHRNINDPSIKRTGRDKPRNDPRREASEGANDAAPLVCAAPGYAERDGGNAGAEDYAHECLEERALAVSTYLRAKEKRRRTYNHPIDTPM